MPNSEPICGDQVDRKAQSQEKERAYRHAQALRIQKEHPEWDLARCLKEFKAVELSAFRKDVESSKRSSPAAQR
ncbi:hypothetical protein WJX73_005421 [Symbiochloris irregularis]|uniref:Uncharacterized protein n=1 Tax=Symbiochloris irregularis TaxID=706552 RepID=A0AAW1PRW6_9CHLO